MKIPLHKFIKLLLKKDSRSQTKLQQERSVSPPGNREASAGDPLPAVCFHCKNILSVTLFRCLPHPNPMFPLGPASSSTTRRAIIAVVPLSPAHRP